MDQFSKYSLKLTGYFNYGFYGDIIKGNRDKKSKPFTLGTGVKTMTQNKKSYDNEL